MRIALTRAVPRSMENAELTHLEREPIDIARAAAQHAEYERALAQLGCNVERIADTPELPDSVFVEDTAVVVDELAVITRPGADSRRPEVASMAAALAQYRTLVTIEAPGTLDGGDVLRIGKHLFVGRSSRTNDKGIAQLRRHLAPFGYRVEAVAVDGALHLKTAVTAIGDNLLLLNSEWVDPHLFRKYEQLAIDPTEPFAANALRLGDAIIYPTNFPRTRERLAARGLTLVEVDASELAKAEGGVTCCCVLVNA